MQCNACYGLPYTACHVSDAAHAALQGALEHDRLGSNTYRRLNIGLATWAAVHLALLASEAAAAPVRWCLM
jgi:hypothetical protein